MRWQDWLGRIAVAAIVGCCLTVGCNKGDSGTGDGEKGSSSSSAVPSPSVQDASAPSKEDKNLETVLVAITGMT